jgi:hypothetical protein
VWCNGGAGYVLLLLKAAEVLDDPGGRCSAAAAAAGEDIWRRGLLRKVLCCGWLGAGMQRTCCYCCMLLSMQLHHTAWVSWHVLSSHICQQQLRAFIRFAYASKQLLCLWHQQETIALLHMLVAAAAVLQGVGLCHSISGNCYALLVMARAIGQADALLTRPGGLQEHRCMCVTALSVLLLDRPCAATYIQSKLEASVRQMRCC